MSTYFTAEPKKIIQALKDVSFEAREGEIVGIIGENGSGKSTLLRIIAGIYRQDEGKIMINGKFSAYLKEKLYKNLIQLLNFQDLKILLTQKYTSFQKE